MNDMSLFLVARPPDQMCEKNIDLLIIVKTIASNFNVRQDLRRRFEEVKMSKTMSYKVVFTLGLPIADNGNKIRKKFFESHLTGRAGSVLNEYNDKNKSQEIFRKILKESETHQDILLGSYFDSYYNLTEKCITSWRWISQFCPNAQTVLIMDDDMWLNLEKIAEFLDSLSERKRLNIAAGTVWDGKYVSRPAKNPSDNRWALHPSVYPWDTFPAYFSGIAAFYGKETILSLAIGSAFVQYLDIDDSFIGIALYKLGIMPDHISSVSYGRIQQMNQSLEVLAGFQ
ncbi:hypothetical protein Ciccas_011850 [Cichlidogyrus casuarinus]|uniref:Hexosyltransferase n=1 Tax=Cichlidogyrus casuarinus TaxID=1844966 RepID=A0ABD2PQ19_9PLAT